jgi:glycogen synthase
VDDRGWHATGFAFREANIPAMLDGLDRALALYTKPGVWRKMQRRAMTREFGWEAWAGAISASIASWRRIRRNRRSTSAQDRT